MSNVIVIDQSLVKSKTWLSLSGAAMSVHLIFRTKCQIGKASRKGRQQRVIANNGKIVFTYDEAEKKYGITRPRFKRAVDELHEKGFIDIHQTGMGLHKLATTYGISERWRDYDTPNFIFKERPKAPQYNVGFKEGNTLWQRRKTNSSDKTVPLPMHENINKPVLVMHNNINGEKVKFFYKFKDSRWLAV